MSAWERANEARNERRQQRNAGRNRKVVITWDAVSPVLVGTFVQLMVLDGRAVLFGTTTSGDTLSVLVYDNGQKESFYIRSGQDPHVELINIADEYSISAGESLLSVLRALERDNAGKDTSSSEKPAKKD